MSDGMESADGLIGFTYLFIYSGIRDFTVLNRTPFLNIYSQLHLQQLDLNALCGHLNCASTEKK